jgi:hypothetical protein
MRSLFIVTAVIEVGAGLVLVSLPALAVRLLLGSSPDTSTLMVVGRVAGAALLALGVACWLARHDDKSLAAAALVAAMVMYNSSAVAILALAGLGPGPTGLLLWPAVVVHGAMAIWCIVCFRSARAK